MTKRILFVDDEPMVLRGIQRSLRAMRGEWDIEFAPGGAEALQAMEHVPFDVVISDMRMPGMNGAELLEQVRARFPNTLRMALSGQSDQATILRATRPTHQYLSKPCDVEDLKRKLTRAFTLSELLHNTHLREVVSQIETVPSLPSSHAALSQVLQAPSPSIPEAAAIISRDMGMTAKVLQLVNSGFLGAAPRIADPAKAVSIVGADHLKILTFSLNSFAPFENEMIDDVAGLWPHSYQTACFARAIAKVYGNTAQAEESFTAGLLHDIGRLVFASACFQEHSSVLRSMAEKGLSVSESEYEIFGCSHSEVGAYLLGLWGIADSIVEAVAWHHDPARAKPNGFSPLIAAHVANHLTFSACKNPHPGDQDGLDEKLLSDLGLSERLPEWTRACQQLEMDG